MTSDNVRKAFGVFFVLGFFIYLFGPLIIMGFTSFNSSPFPRVSPWECFTVEWFELLTKDDKLLEGLKNSVFIGLGVVTVSVPLGLAGALMLTQVKERVRPWYYTIVISPILVPGVVLGISTLLFWDRIGSMFGASRNSIFYDGFFLTIIGQATFISAYTMLVFISRLQRFDRDQEEAALDLGATHVQTFRKILLPFLKPAIASACVLAFLASFENYNTTVFTIVSESTLTTFLAAKVRHGINPSISALAVVIVVITLFGAALHEVLKRREIAAEKTASLIAGGQIKARKKQRSFFIEPAVLMILAIFISGIGTAYFAGTTGVQECKADVLVEKKRVTAEKIKALQEKTAREAKAKAEGSTPGAESSSADKLNRAGTENFNSIFSTGNLKGQTGTAEKSEPQLPAQEKESSRVGTENFNSIFSTSNLTEQAGAEPVVEEEAPRVGTENFNSIFSAGNLTGQPEGDDESPSKGDKPQEDKPRAGTENFNSIFSPKNLNGQTGTNE